MTTANTPAAAAPAVEKASQDDLFDLFGVDTRRTTGGAPWKVGGTTFQILPLSNPRYQAARQRLMVEGDKKFGPATDDDTEDQILEREAFFKQNNRELMAKHLIAGWDALHFKGKVHPSYTREVAVELMSMDAFVDQLITFAGSHKNYSAALSKAEEKN